VTGDGGVPALLKLKDSSSWEYVSAAAASVAEELEDECSVSTERLAIESAPGARASQAFSGQSPPTPRIEILVEPAEK
jgi:hypothetical protein